MYLISKVILKNSKDRSITTKKKEIRSLIIKQIHHLKLLFLIVSQSNSMKNKAHAHQHNLSFSAPFPTLVVVMKVLSYKIFNFLKDGSKTMGLWHLGPTNRRIKITHLGSQAPGQLHTNKKIFNSLQKKLLNNPPFLGRGTKGFSFGKYLFFLHFH